MVLTQTQLEDLLSSYGSYTVGSGYDDLIAGHAIEVRDSQAQVVAYRSPGIAAIDRVVASIVAAGGDVVSIVTGQSVVAEPNDALRQQPAGSVEPPAMSTAEKKTMMLKWGLLAAGLWLLLRSKW